MRKRLAGSIPWAACVLVAILLTGRAATAEEISSIVNPKTANNTWVSDMAGVLGEVTKDSISRILDDLERRSAGEMAVVTIHTTGGRDARGFATELLNTWGVGKKGKDDGVLMLVVVDDHRVEVETGYGAEVRLPDGLVGRILDAEVVPRFKSGDLEGGVLAGVREMARVLEGGPPASHAPDAEGGPPASHAPDADRHGALGSEWRSLTDEASAKRMPLWPFFAFIGVAGLIAWWAVSHRYCPKCRRRMRRLDDQQEDAYLSSDAVFEESLKSVDHQVWRCDTCAICKIEEHVQWFSGFSVCPKCRRRTVRTSSRTVVEATYERAGREEVTRTCALPTCRFRDVRIRPIPRLEQSSSSGGSSWSSGGFSGGSSSSSSSSGSFGGGSSGGGGAGRSW